MRDPIYHSDGEVDQMTHIPLPPPRVVKNQPIGWVQAVALVVTVAIVVCGAGYIVWGWVR